MAGYAVTYSVVDNATKQIDAINRRIAAMRAPMDRMSRSVSRFVDVSGLRKVAQGFDWIGKARERPADPDRDHPGHGRHYRRGLDRRACQAGARLFVLAHTLVATADNIGITTQELQKFQDATKLAGGNADDMTEGRRAAHTALTDMNIGRGNAAETAQALNFLGALRARRQRPLCDPRPTCCRN